MKRVIVVGPALSQSGYGEQCRFALRSLMSKPDLFDVYVKPTSWGSSNWLMLNDKDKPWIDQLIAKTIHYTQMGGTFDISIQVTIPNEWEKLTPINIGYTAGIETNKIAPQWIQKSTLMDKIITISNHSKDTFVNTVYEALDQQTNQTFTLQCETPVDVAHYPVREYDVAECNLELKHDFNFLLVSQWGPRKNLDNTIRWWVEEFKDDEVGLVVKTNLYKNSLIDRNHAQIKLQNLLSEYPDRKCGVYLLHGYMTPEEMTGLYQNEKIKCLATLTHGEGFGLPLFEAAYNGLPIVAPNWSGHVDFLHAERKMRKNKKTVKKLAPCFAEVKYELGQIGPEAVWEGVLQEDSYWCYPKQGSYKETIRKVYTDYNRFKKYANILKDHVEENFKAEDMYGNFCDAIYKPTLEEESWMDQLSQIEIL